MLDKSSWLEFIFGRTMPPHGHCFLWNDSLVYLHVISNSIIVAAYYSIPLALFYLIKKRDDLVFDHIFALFGAFIFLCGTTHLITIWNIWHGAYWLSGVADGMTAIVSLITAIMVWPLIPKALAIPSNNELRQVNEQLLREITDKNSRTEELQLLRENLEKIVEEKTGKLRQSEFRYRTLIENISTIVWTRSSSGEFIEEQPAWESYTGQCWEEYRNFGWINAIHKDDRERVLQTWKQGILTKNIICKGERIWHEPTKSYRIFQVNAAPILDEKGEIQEWIGADEEITKQIFAEEKFRLALEAAPTAMLITNDQGEIEHANQEAIELFGYSLLEFSGMSIEQLVPEDYRKAHHQHRQDYYQDLSKRQMGSNIDLYARHKNGKVIPVEIGLNPIKVDNTITVLCSVMDISHRKAHEEELANKNWQLTNSNKELEQFAYVASHDLKEPIRKISAFSEILHKKISTKLSSDELDYLNRITNATERMGKLINDLLFFSRVSTNVNEAEKVDLNEVLKHVLMDYETRIIESGAVINYEELPVINGVKSEMYQLFSNLIGNALKFHKPNQVPDISIRINSRREICIEDKGIGIAPENSERIFGLFERLHGRSEYEGSGIGLAVCKKVMQTYGGNIILESELGSGSRFILKFSDINGSQRSKK